MNARQLAKAMQSTSQAAFPDLYDLVHLFYRSPDELGQFTCVEGTEMPPVYRTLLEHNHHMTVTVESHHHCSVDVQVLAHMTQGKEYLRKILLVRKSDARVVQFGIVRLRLDHLDPVVRGEIESRQIPLGRVLIQRNVLRRVELGKLWRVVPGQELHDYFQSPHDSVSTQPRVTFGRTAVIHVNEEPAVELLEIVSPEPT